MRRNAALVVLATLLVGTSTLQAQSRRDRERDRGLVEQRLSSGIALLVL